MAIPESQLATWSHQGSITQSSDTYQLIRKALLASDSGYSDKSFSVFLQGSYGNDTNIYADSDVDIVICLNSTFRYFTNDLPDDQAKAYAAYVSPATYSYEQFKAAVVSHLMRRFGNDSIKVGDKAVRIKSGQGRRDADIIVCYEYRHYKSFSVIHTDDYVSGIVFPTSGGEIINYPKQHSANLTEQHQSSGAMLKPMVRILKNMRNRMVADKLIGSDIAPSYYIEGMFYNVPREQYVNTSFGDTFCNGVNWLRQTDKTKLVCANWQYYLLGNCNVQWTTSKYDQYLAGLVSLWSSW